MATWTNITNAALEPGKPIRSVDGLALRDNPVAITEGASGAPKIVNAAITDSTLGAEKFQAGTTERDWVLARTATASAGAVGTYAFLNSSAGTLSFGLTTSAVNLAPSNVAETTLGSVSGTWRCMGYSESGASETTLFLRIA